MPEDISDITYESSGVSIKDQNEVNQEVIRRLKELGIDVKGLFGGAIDIGWLKGIKSVPIGIVTQRISEDETSLDAGRTTAFLAMERTKRLHKPLAILDYYASEAMDSNVPDFVEGVAGMGLEHKVTTIGGESAQMPGTYKPGKRDAFVDVIYLGDRGETVDIAHLIKDMKQPLLCASTDGTGTKTDIVKDPIDIIRHGCNDLAAIGVMPIGFKLYVAGNEHPSRLRHIENTAKVRCERAGLAYLGATIVPAPEVYNEGKVDIAGTVIGVIDRDDLITGKDVQEGDVVIGMSTDGLMTNGYSFARKLRDWLKKEKGIEFDAKLEALAGNSQKDELSKPHTDYTDVLFGAPNREGLLSKYGKMIKATAHVTGGGQKDNIARMVPDGLCAVVRREVLPLPPIVRFYREERANVEDMYKSLNMGVGFTITVSADMAGEVLQYLNENFKYGTNDVVRDFKVIGRIEKSSDGEKMRWAA